MTENFRIEWRDAGREPQCPSNPDYPHGIAVDLSRGSVITCQAPLPYPAPRCGHFSVTCLLCGIRVAVTTAGRPDDPNLVKIACRTMGSA